MSLFKKQLYFEWDSNKAAQNKIKHGISFTTAAKVFDDINRLEYYDINHSIAEDRYITIGLVHNVLVVVYTMRSHRIRIISARIANKAEEQTYYES